MKNIKLVVPDKSKKEMNDLVDAICLIVGENAARMRDKFKMVTAANPKKIMDLCRHLNLNVEFRNSKSGNEIAVELKNVPEDFSLDSIANDPAPEEPTKEEEVEEVDEPNAYDKDSQEESDTPAENVEEVVEDEATTAETVLDPPDEIEETSVFDVDSNKKSPEEDTPEDDDDDDDFPF